MKSSPLWARYSEDELRVLVEEYEELKDAKHKAFIHVRLMDIDRAMARLTPKLRVAVLLLGPVGLTTRTAGKLVGVSAMTMSNRYRHGLENMALYLNGRETLPKRRT